MRAILINIILAVIIILFLNIRGILLQGIINRELIFTDYKGVFTRDIKKGFSQAAFLTKIIALSRL
jgi:hypothetical protein